MRRTLRQAGLQPATRARLLLGARTRTARGVGVIMGTVCGVSVITRTACGVGLTARGVVGVIMRGQVLPQCHRASSQGARGRVELPRARRCETPWSPSATPSCDGVAAASATCTPSPFTYTSAAMRRPPSRMRIARGASAHTRLRAQPREGRM